jgi:glycerophosphoryl diester phosphodiesterase
MLFSLLAPFDHLIAPPPAEARVGFLGKQAFAHRGLHGGPVVENSRAAFTAAIASGLGIELDVQAARGGDVFVFHDATLDRLTAATGPIAIRVAQELDQIYLSGTSETIPRLGDILSLVAGQVPILIEVKTSSRAVGGFCLAVRRALEGYLGPVAVMSFNPEVGRWLNEHAPKLVRGLVITQEGQAGLLAGLKGRLIRQLSLWRAKPDFLAYDIRDLPASFPTRQRARGLKVLTWTVRSGPQEALALQEADEIIFERPQRAR